jgi:hypothetical protein
MIDLGMVGMMSEPSLSKSSPREMVWLPLLLSIPCAMSLSLIDALRLPPPPPLIECVFLCLLLSLASFPKIAVLRNASFFLRSLPPFFFPSFSSFPPDPPDASPVVAAAASAAEPPAPGDDDGEPRGETMVASEPGGGWWCGEKAGACWGRMKEDERAPGVKAAGDVGMVMTDPPRSGEPPLPAQEAGDGGNMGCMVSRRPFP